MEVAEKITMKWYIVRSQSNREKNVAERITNESLKGDLMGKVGRVLVPTENTFYLKNNKKVKREKVLYPGYIFVETNAIGELKYFLKGMNGASGFLTNRSGEILPLSESEINRMIGQQELASVEVETPFVVGEEVKIIDGPFSSMLGKIESINEQKVKLNVTIFGRITPLDLNISQIDKK
jgi:transcriptional antiterminator NusG